MNKPMATPNHLREQEEHDIQCDKYQADIGQRTAEYMADPISLLSDTAIDAAGSIWAKIFAEAFILKDDLEVGHQLRVGMELMAKQQATEDVEKGYE